MKELTIISGKGGTGKTTVTAAFADLADNKIMTDCDVDAADLHLLLNPEPVSEQPFIGGREPRLTVDKCTGCGTCEELCRFDAIHVTDTGVAAIDRFSCDHCGLCALACPEGAIAMADAENGTWFISRTRCGSMVHACLGIAEDNSGKLVTLVRREARKLAELEGADLIINDGPPGIGCPVTASITGADLVLLVVEPTVSGIHDMERVHGLCRHFRIPVLAAVNKYTVNLVNTQKIRGYCEEYHIPLVGEIPFAAVVNRALVARRSVVDYDCGPVTQVVRDMWEEVARRLEDMPVAAGL
ncbi:MAG: ATP-binding protein [Deltaproteobacteria bacterium]|nr:ATP-binding protein [Candidatus Anaeroferrophillacea bacterium]